MVSKILPSYWGGGGSRIRTYASGLILTPPTLPALLTINRGGASEASEATLTDDVAGDRDIIMLIPKILHF